MIVLDVYVLSISLGLELRIFSIVSSIWVISFPHLAKLFWNESYQYNMINDQNHKLTY